MIARSAPDPRIAQALALQRSGRRAEAQAIFHDILKSAPGDFDALYLLGVSQAQAGQFAEAEALMRRALAVDPDSPNAQCDLGNVLLGMRRPADAVACFDRAIALKPDLAEAHLNRGNALMHLGRPADAVASYDRVLETRPNLGDAHANRGVALLQLRQFEAALASIDKALRVSPATPVGLASRAEALRGLRRHEEAIAGCDRAIALNPKAVPAWLTRAKSLQALSRHDEAVDSYRRALAITPSLRQAWYGCGISSFALKRPADAAAAYDKVLALGEFDYARGMRLHAKMHACDWRDFDAACAQVLAGVRDGKRTAVPLAILPIASNAADQLRCAQTHVAHAYPALEPLWRGEAATHDRHPHRLCFDRPVRPRGRPPDGRPVRTPRQIALRRHRDFHRPGPRCRGAPAHPGGVRPFHRRADLAGPAHCRTDARARDRYRGRRQRPHRRPAHRRIRAAVRAGSGQLSRLSRHVRAGHISTTSSPTARSFRTASEPFYTEKVVCLPDSYQPNDARRPIAERTPARAEAGLPETGFVFCSFNNTFKITPDVFDVWMRLLQQIEGSVLWLFEANPDASANLRHEAQARGVAPERLVFAPRAELADHLARHRLADLCLDTLYYNGHTTGSDALWAGVPFVTMPGATFASRVGASLLNAAGLPEQIAGSLAEYEALAFKLAREPRLIAELKDKLARNRAGAPLFDTARYTRHLETAFTLMMERHRRGEPPASFAVPAI